ncbi:MAG: hypothetical protein WC679_02715 [Bacteroidales bacterium]|jgi:hypothetical protein
MSLPEVKYSVHKLTVPSTQEQVAFRPFKVKEHKVLLQALELGDTVNFIETIYAIINACTFEKLDVSKLRMEDIDYIFLKLRAKSHNQIINTSYKCIKPDLEGVPCNKNINVPINLEEVKTYYPENFNKNRIVMVNDSAGIKFNNPTFESFKLLSKIENVTGLFNVTEAFLYSCIECVFDGENIQVPGVDFTQEEMVAYIEDLDSSVIDQINLFFENMPYTGLEIDVKCPKCGNSEHFTLRNLEDFFV